MPIAPDAEFDEFAADYDSHLKAGLSLAGESKEYFARMRIEWVRDRLAAWGHPVGRALDFGCGTGTSTPMLIDLLGATEALGLDVSPKSLELAPRGPGLSYAEVDEHHPAADRDLVFTNGVFHHIPHEKQAQAAAYLRDCLRPYGLVALWENSPFNPGTRYGMKMNEFDRDVVMVRPGRARALLQESGLRVLRTDFLFVFPHVLRHLRWLEPHLSSWPIGGQYVVLAQRVD